MEKKKKKIRGKPCREAPKTCQGGISTDPARTIADKKQGKILFILFFPFSSLAAYVQCIYVWAFQVRFQQQRQSNGKKKGPHLVENNSNIQPVDSRNGWTGLKQQNNTRQIHRAWTTTTTRTRGRTPVIKRCLRPKRIHSNNNGRLLISLLLLRLTGHCRSTQRIWGKI